MGVEIDEYNRPVKYYFREASIDNYQVGQLIEIPADEIIHIFKHEFVGQTRGFGDIVASVDSLKQLDDYAIAELFAAKVSACQGIFYERNGASPAGDMIDANTVEEENGVFLSELAPGEASIVPQGYNITLPDGQNKQVFSHYSLETLQNIINNIKNSNLSFQQIADKYKLDVSMIYYLNRGDYHTQTDEQYPLRPVKDFSKKITLCIDCNKPISYGSKRCEECAKIAQRTVTRPSREEFKHLIRKCSFVELGKQYNVSDKAIVKWCKFYNLPFRKKDIKQYSDEQWEEL